ncbi:MAG TPA: glycoside hydrolase family 3 N-terminal domain-containing protein [Baekduia sp.]|nr:glycoside hydrolase family 3 N-terminal domain-containing protein [Baekduia sp.]
MTWPRIAGLAGCLTVVIVAVVLLVGGGNGGRAVLEAGPSFGASTSTPASTTVPASTTSAPAGTGTANATAAASSGGLPAPAARAVARLFLIGFGGRRAPRGVLRRFALHEWGGVVLQPGNGVSPQQVADLVGQVRGAARRAGHEPPLIAASQLGGDLDAVPVGAALQSAAGDAAGARAWSLAVAGALRPLGIRMVLAPDGDIGYAGGPWEGIAFSDDPATAATMTAAAVSGWKDGGVAPVPGHFPGEGAASGDPALEAATVGVSLDELRQRDLQPFAAIAAQAPAIQLSAATYVAFDGVTPATLLPDVVTLLRRDYNFDGVIVSGDLAAASLAGGEPVADLAVRAVKAGVDLVWIPGDAGDQDASWRAVVRALRTGEIPASRVADALRRVGVLRASYSVN